ncbi:hypothetical protein, partial [Okeania hirsuta]|uniref:hypothetical protein n=2 Tax=Okeania TaxID=1458928 RepID=UPI001961C1AC
MLPPGADVTFCVFSSLVKDPNINARAAQLTNIGFVIVLVIFILSNTKREKIMLRIVRGIKRQ